MQTARPAASDIRPTGQEVVQGQTQTPFPARHALPTVKRQHERKRLHQMRGVLQEKRTFLQRFVNEGEMPVFEIPQAAVNELRGGGAGPGGKIALVDERDAP